MRERLGPQPPVFSICIPQFNRTSFLIQACEALAAQDFRNFEVCISDDCSNDGRVDDLLAFLEASNLQFIYRRMTANVRYDGNVRSAIGLARGRYCFLHGNDDCLTGTGVLGDIHQAAQRHGMPEVIVTNFEDWSTGEITKRVPVSALQGSGPAVAVVSFRNVAFVSGVVIDRRSAQEIATEKWDGTEMYQMYLTSRIIASGGRLLNLDMSAIRKDIRIPGENVDSYALKAKAQRAQMKEILLPMRYIGQVVADAVQPFVAAEQPHLIRGIFLQLYRFTYPFWVVEYRRIHSWRYAAGVVFGLRPHVVLGGVRFGILDRAKIFLAYVSTTVLALCLPKSLLLALKPIVYRFAKRSR